MKKKKVKKTAKKPVYDLPKGLQQTIEWYQNNNLG